jgi:hypothetical protein
MEFFLGPGSRNNKTIVSSKLNQVRIDGEPHNPFGLLFAVGGVNGRDEITKRQRLLLVIDLHGMRIGGNRAGAVGLYPISRVTTPMPTGLPVKVPSFSGFVFMR